MKDYKLELPELKGLSKEEALSTINIIRQFLYQTDVNVTPIELIIDESHRFKSYMDPQLFAKRLANLKFEEKAEHLLVQAIIQNDTEELKEIYSSDLQFYDSESKEKIEVLSKDVLLMVVPKNTEKITIGLKFLKGQGINDGKYLSYAGFSYDQKEDNYIIYLSSLHDVNSKVKTAIAYLKELI